MEEQLKVTCLHDSHLALGAKMSPFAGFDIRFQVAGRILTVLEIVTPCADIQQNP